MLRLLVVLLLVATLSLGWMVNVGFSQQTSSTIPSTTSTTYVCHLYSFVPFTNDSGQTMMSISGDPQRPNPGFVHMSAALLAIEHFNSRNTSIVKELDDFKSCPVQLSITTNNSNSSSSLFFDTGGEGGHAASRSLFDSAWDTTKNVIGNNGDNVVMPQQPCAIVGPFHDVPALELSTMASASRIPLVAHRAYNSRVASPIYSPYSTLVYPDYMQISNAAIMFLQSKGRTNYTSVFYPLSDSGVQHREIVMLALQDANYDTYTTYYVDPTVDVTGHSKFSTRDNLLKIKQRGFRTIIVLLENPTVEIPDIANAAAELDMLNGDDNNGDSDYFWMWIGPFYGGLLDDSNNSDNVFKLLYGSVWVTAIEPYFYSNDTTMSNDPFYATFTNLDSDFVDRVNAVNPIQPGDPGYLYAQPDFFQNLNVIEMGAGFIYDAVISIGMGACSVAVATDAASEKATPPLANGSAFVDAIRSVDFMGASGRVRFRNSGLLPGARDWNTEWFGAFNLLPKKNLSESEKPFAFSDVHEPGSKTWTEVVPFIYPDGSTTNPPLLRDPTEHNYLNDGLRGLGFALFGIAVLFALGSCAWVFVHRANKVVRAAQPFFLYTISFGCILFSSAIIPLSFDESDGWTEDQLSAACQSVPWLAALGFIFIYSGLFTKLWRVNKVLQFSRRKIEIRHVAWPASALFLLALLILALWTALAPFTWERVIINDYTGESIGHCQSTNFGAFAVALLVVMLIPAGLTAVMAWKTKDVDDAYSEGLWVFGLIGVQIELLILGAPVIVILRDVSVDGRYIGYILLLWSFPMTTLLLMMCPKMFAYWKSLKQTTAKRKRGAKSRGEVSGVSYDSAAPSGYIASSPGAGGYATTLPPPNVMTASNYTRADDATGKEAPTTMGNNPTPGSEAIAADSTSSPAEAPTNQEADDQLRTTSPPDEGQDGPSQQQHQESLVEEGVTITKDFSDPSRQEEEVKTPEPPA